MRKHTPGMQRWLWTLEGINKMKETKVKEHTLQLAQALEDDMPIDLGAVSAELRRLHAENKLLHERHSNSNEILAQHASVNQELLEALTKAWLWHSNPQQWLAQAYAVINKANGQEND